MRQSMTGFAARTGSAAGHDWTWELRGVNAKGLDLRLRLPDWIDGLEPALRKAVPRHVRRGSVQVALRVTGADQHGPARLDPAQLAGVLDALATAQAEADARGLHLAPSTAAEILALRGVLSFEPPAADHHALRDAIVADFEAALEAFVAMRKEEGGRLAAVIAAQIDEIERLLAEARTAAQARAQDAPERLRAQLARVLDTAEGVEPDRLAQELALIAIRGDVTEELDRLRLHCAAARGHLAEEGAVGRTLDFLCQEFMREANTLCSKSNDAALTAAGLALKTVIEQMREQIQNLE